jgi:hypothetical protein
MTDFKEGDEVLVRGVIEMLDYAQKPAKIKVGEDGFAWVEEVGELIPLSALDVNKQLLEAAKKAIGYCEEISTYGSKYGVLEGPIVSDARYIARGLEDAIAAAEKGA